MQRRAIVFIRQAENAKTERLQTWIFARINNT